MFLLRTSWAGTKVPAFFFCVRARSLLRHSVTMLISWTAALVEENGQDKQPVGTADMDRATGSMLDVQDPWRFPEPEDNGIRYLKLPVDRL